jgi:hypothetical protein
METLNRDIHISAGHMIAAAAASEVLRGEHAARMGRSAPAEPIGPVGEMAGIRQLNGDVQLTTRGPLKVALASREPRTMPQLSGAYQYAPDWPGGVYSPGAGTPHVSTS